MKKSRLAAFGCPRSDSKKPLRESHTSETILEMPLQHVVMTAARKAYRALGGTEAEWMPRAGNP
jgi:hypothetical protein